MDTGAQGASGQKEEWTKAWQVLETRANSMILGDDQAWTGLVTALQEVALPGTRSPCVLERGARYREALELEIQGYTQDESFGCRDFDWSV